VLHLNHHFAHCWMVLRWLTLQAMLLRVRVGLGGHLLLLLALCSELTDGVPSAAKLGKTMPFAQEVMRLRRWIGFVQICSRECFLSIETHFRRLWRGFVPLLPIKMSRKPSTALARQFL